MGPNIEPEDEGQTDDESTGEATGGRETGSAASKPRIVKSVSRSKSGKDTEAESKEADETLYTKEEVDNLLKRERAKVERSLASQREQAEEEAARKAAEEAGNFKELYEKEARRASLLERRQAQLEQEAIKRDIAEKYKLPKKLALRLEGETEAELEADAKALAKELRASLAPETEGGSRPAISKDKLLEAEIEAQRQTGRYQLM